MAEILQPADGQPNGGGLPATTTTSEAAVFGLKRQRRPSVRLGDIGGDHNQSYDSLPRRSTTKQWKQPYLGLDHRKEPILSGKGSKTRPLTNLGSDYNSETLEEEKERNLDSIAIGSWKVKKRGGGAVATTKRPRCNWASKIDENASNDANQEQGEGKYSGGEDMEDGYRDFELENSESLKQQSPINSSENLAFCSNVNRRINTNPRARVSENREMELSGPSDNNNRDWRNGRTGRYGVDGVRIWLNGLGLEKYLPVFEIHEVDDEVLPLLTLEDLKDMGVNAVGSRRKMYCAIQKLGNITSRGRWCRQ